MARCVVSLVTVALAVSVLALAPIGLFLRPAARGSRERRERAGRRTYKAIGLLGVGIGGVLDGTAPEVVE